MSRIGSESRGDADVDAAIVAAGDVEFDVETDVLIAGGGGTGLVAALAAAEDPDVRVTVLEKTSRFGGNTSLSTGMVPAADTRMQREAGIDETPADMARDILEKNGYEADEERVRHLCRESATLVHWLVDDHDIELALVDDFKYPKHSTYRMHAPPGRNGENLIEQLHARLDDRDNVELLLHSPVHKLVVADEAVVGAVAGKRRAETIAAGKVILATDGYAGNTRMVENYCGEIADAIYFGADGNTGDGIRLGEALGGELACMDAYQAHATVTQSGALSTYAIVMNGGILLNERGERFGNEAEGYSAFAVSVLEQPDGVAYELFDRRIREKLEGSFDDFDEALSQGAYERGETVEELADVFGFDEQTATATVDRYNDAVAADEPDEVGRVDGRAVLEPPFYGAKVTGALFHTQGGLEVDDHGRVLRTDGTVVDNLYAGGGAACGISGHGADGYLSGNGLTTALGYGRLAGLHARESL